MCLGNYYYIDSKTVYDALIALCSSVKFYEQNIYFTLLYLRFP